MGIEGDLPANAVVAGDLVVGVADGVIGALTIGAESYVLSVVGGQLTWAPASGGGASVPVFDEGGLLTPAVSSFNFTGAGVTATAVGNDVTVDVPASGAPTDSFAIGGTLNAGWDTTAKIIEMIAAKSTFVGDTSLGSGFGRNVYFDGTDFRYEQNGVIALLLMTDLTITAYSAPSGTADAVATLTVQWQSNLSTGKITVTQDADIQGIPFRRGGSKSNLLTTLGIGVDCLPNLAAGYGTFAIGDMALQSATTSYRNLGIGGSALKFLNPASDAITSVEDLGGGSIRFHTPGTHNISAPCNFVVTGSTLYDGNYSVTAINPDVSWDAVATFLGDDVGIWHHPDGTQANVAVGSDAGINANTGSQNTFIGDVAGRDFQNGNRNTCVGSNTVLWGTGSGNTMIGNGAGTYTNWDGSNDNNIAINSGGADRIVYNASGNLFRFQSNSFFYAQGVLASILNPFAAPDSTAWGMGALGQVSVSSQNTAFGTALKNLVSIWGPYTAIQDNGSGFAQYLTTADLTAMTVGDYIFGALFTGSGPYATIQQVTAINPGVSFDTAQAFTIDPGPNGFADFSVSRDNTAVGALAGNAMNYGASNTLLGATAGPTITTGKGNTLLGNNAGASIGATDNNKIVLSNGAGDRLVYDEATGVWLFDGLLQDDNGPVGYRGIPPRYVSADTTTVALDAGRQVVHAGTDATPRTFTVDSQANVPCTDGTTITFLNQNGGGDVTIVVTTETMRLAGTGATGARTLVANGIATAVWYATPGEWYISGTGLT